MKQSKVFRVISALTTVELNRLVRFVSSPYFNSDQRLIDLLEYYSIGLRKKQFIEDDEHIQSEILKDDSNPSHIRIIKSKLLSLIQEFLTIEELRLNPALEAVHLLTSIQRRELDGMISTAKSTARKMIEREHFRSSSHYYNLYEYEKNVYSLDKIEEKRLNKSTKDRLNLGEIIGNLDLFYIGEKLKYECSKLQWERLLSLNEEADEIKDIIERIDSDKKFSTPHIQIYKNIYLTLRDPENNSSFEELKALIDDHIHEFPILEAKSILDSAYNFCLRRINKGDLEFLKELLQLYKKSLDSGVIIVNGRISPWTFKNIVSAALRNKEYSWADQFIHDYDELLPTDFKQSIGSLARAQVAYYLGNYTDVLRSLQNVEFKEFSLKVNAEMTLLATYYELDEYLALADEITSFNKFLRRQKNVNPIQTEYCLNFTKILKKLTSASNSGEEVTKIKEAILETSNLASKSWLLEKVDELLGESTARS